MLRLDALCEKLLRPGELPGEERDRAAVELQVAGQS